MCVFETELSHLCINLHGNTQNNIFDWFWWLYCELFSFIVPAKFLWCTYASVYLKSHKILVKFGNFQVPFVRWVRIQRKKRRGCGSIPLAFDFQRITELDRSEHSSLCFWADTTVKEFRTLWKTVRNDENLSVALFSFQWCGLSSFRFIGYESPLLHLFW